MRQKDLKRKKQEEAAARLAQPRRRQGKGIRRLVKDGDLLASDVLAQKGLGGKALSPRITAWLEKKARLE